MWLRLSVLLFALAFQASFPSISTQTLRQRYGQPIAETFLLRPGIVVSASYGPSGKTCELVISPKPPDGMVKRLPGPDAIDYTVMKDIEDELVPVSERGKLKMGAFINVECMEGDCAGAEQDWENVVMYRNPGRGTSRFGTVRYETIQWHRDECGSKVGYLNDPSGEAIFK